MTQKNISIHILPRWKRESEEGYNAIPSYKDIILPILENEDTYALRTVRSSKDPHEAVVVDSNDFFEEKVAGIVVESFEAFDSAIKSLRTSNQFKGLSITSIIVGDNGSVNSLINDFSIDYDIDFEEITTIKKPASITEGNATAINEWRQLQDSTYYKLNGKHFVPIFNIPEKRRGQYDGLN